MEDAGKIRDTIKGGLISALPELGRMASGDMSDETIEACLKELVENAVTGSESCAIKAVEILTVKYRTVTERNRQDIIKWIFEFTENRDEDSWTFFLGFNFVLKLDWDELYVKYIKAYDDYLRVEFDDDYIEFYDLGRYVS